MPRTARKICDANIYHVMLRGINRQNIFEDDEDRLCFMSLLKHYKKFSGFKLHAFVLMSNHIHLLIEPANEALDTIFRRIGTAYAGWYNKKYQRTGHLFQDRFRSENVENLQYFVTVLRYIIQNPMKAGLEPRPGYYRWSSYLAYKGGTGAVTDTQYASTLFSNKEAMIEFLLQGNDDTAMDEKDFDRRLREENAKEKMNRITQCSSVSEFQQLDPQQQKKYAAELYQKGLSLGQISRMTGIPKTTVYNTVRVFKGQSTDNDDLVLRESDSSSYQPNIIW